jgi:hypothetical protein
MATTSIEATNLFKVDGLVAVITGGGTGEAHALFTDCATNVFQASAL